MKMYSLMYGISLTFIILTLSSCCRHIQKHTVDAAPNSVKTQAGPPVIVYKTSHDYNNKVPISLKDDKSSVQSFPGIKDIYFQGELATPTLLHQGYLLDNRGIDVNVAFLSITYEEYSRLPETPSASQLFSLILDNDPLLEMYHCGNRYHYKDLVDELNRRIDSGQLGEFKRLK